MKELAVMKMEIKRAESNYKKYIKLLDKKGNDTFSSTIYNGVRVNTTYREVLVSRYNLINGNLEKKDITVKDIKKYNRKMVALLSL